MRKSILSVSDSLTVSTKTEALVMEVGHSEGSSKYFVEYPTNVLPDHRNMYVRGNRITPLTDDEYKTLCDCIKSFGNKKETYNFLHAPTYITAYLEALNIDLVLF